MLPGALRVFSSAFERRTGPTNVAIPSYVISLGNVCFFGWTRLGAIVVDTGNPAYSNPDGVLFDKNQSTGLAYPEAADGTILDLADLVLYQKGPCFILRRPI